MNLARKNREFWHKETKAFRLNSQSGQAGIILVLITVVLVTISLSVASRSVTDISISKQEEETTRAYDAAEAGIEEALRQDIATLTSTGTYTDSITVDAINVDYSIEPQSDIEFLLEELEAVEIDVSGFTNDIDIEWGATGEVCNAADPRLPGSFASIEVTTIAGSVSTRFLYSGIGCNRSSVGILDGFDRVSPNPSSPTTTGYLWKVVRNMSGVDTIRIRAVYASTSVLVSAASGSLPTQSWIIHSEAQAPGGETRAVEVTQKAPAPPSIFDFVIFSGFGDLSK